MRFPWLLLVSLPLAISPLPLNCEVFPFKYHVGDLSNRLSTRVTTYGECYDGCSQEGTCGMFTFNLVEERCFTYSAWSDEQDTNEKVWITGNCTTNSNPVSIDQFSNDSFTKILSEAFYIGNSRFLGQAKIKGADYGSRYNLEWIPDHFSLWSSYDGTSSYNGRVGRLLGSVFSPNQKTSLSTAAWTTVKDEVTYLDENGNLEKGLTEEIQKMMDAANQAQDVIAFVIVDEPFDGYHGIWYPTPFDDILSSGPVEVDGRLEGGYVVQLFEIARAVETSNSSSCLPLILTGRSNHCMQCLFSTHWEFSSLVSLLVRKGLLDGIGMAMNLDESKARMDDISTVMNYYTEQGINIYITALSGSVYDIGNVTKMCINDARCVSLNLDVAVEGEQKVATTLSDNSDLWISRSPLAPICSSNNAVLLIPGQTIQGTTTNKNNTFGGPGNDALFKFRVYPANGIIVELKCCSTSDNFNTVLRVYTDKAFSTQFAMNYFFQDETDCQGASKLDMIFIKGWYYFLVEGFNGTQGDFSVSLTYKNTTTGKVLESAAGRPRYDPLNLLAIGFISLVITTFATRY